MTSDTPSAKTLRPATSRVVLLLLLAAVIAVALNAVVAMIAISAGAPADYGPLMLPAYALSTVVGVAVGWAGWSLIRRRARNAGRTLAIVVPIVLVLSFLPDLLLLAFRFIPGTTAGAAVALMVMHLVVAGVALPAYALISRSTRVELGGGAAARAAA